jgi:hypothetical protein
LSFLDDLVGDSCDMGLLSSRGQPSFVTAEHNKHLGLSLLSFPINPSDFVSFELGADDLVCPNRFSGEGTVESNRHEQYFAATVTAPQRRHDITTFSLHFTFICFALFVVYLLYFLSVCPFLKFEHRREGVDISRHVSSAQHLLLSAQWSPGLPLPTSTALDTVGYYGATFAPAPSAHKIIGPRPISALDGHVQSLADVTRRPADIAGDIQPSRGASKGGLVHEDRIWLFFCPA